MIELELTAGGVSFEVWLETFAFIGGPSVYMYIHQALLRCVDLPREILLDAFVQCAKSSFRSSPFASRAALPARDDVIRRFVNFLGGHTLGTPQKGGHRYEHTAASGCSHWSRSTMRPLLRAMIVEAAAIEKAIRRLRLGHSAFPDTRSEGDSLGTCLWRFQIGNFIASLLLQLRMLPVGGVDMSQQGRREHITKTSTVVNLDSCFFGQADILQAGRALLAVEGVERYP